ncbi:hypothetical protein PG988_006172 [Apiospora saccharicola]
MLFQMGYRDIDFDIEYGDPPITKASQPDYINWLIQRGADLERRIRPVGNDQSKTSGIFSAHYAMFNLGGEIENKQGCRNTVASAIARILPLSLTDDCSCKCSTEGCTPIIYMLKNFYWDRHELPGIMDMDFIILCGGGQPYVVKDRGEVEEIQQEESALISILDEMVDELARRIGHITGDPAQLQACWENYWHDYAHAVLEKLENSRMTEDERRSAEMIGVVWKRDTNVRLTRIENQAEDTVEDKINRLFRELESIGKDVE